MTNKIPKVGRGRHSVNVIRFPNGGWSYGGNAGDLLAEYPEAEVYEVFYDSYAGWITDNGKKVKAKAQAYRRRQLKK